MNIFHLLKSKSGKLALGAQQLAVIGVGAVALYYVGSMATTQEVQKINAIRTNVFAQQGAPTANAGMRQTKEGLSAMHIANLGNGYNQVETNLSKMAADDAPTFSDVDENSIANSMSGAFEGFGSSSNRAEEINPANGGSGYGYGGGDSYGADGAYGGGSRAGKDGRGAARGSYGGSNGGAVNSLSKTSRATASGGVSMSPFGGRSGVGGFSAKASNGERHTLSGRMDGGSNMVALKDAASSGKASKFNNQAMRVGAGSETQGLKGKKLKELAEHSTTLAERTATNASNEMSDVFLASNQVSGGMGIAADAGTEGGVASSSDFASPSDMKARAQRINKKLDDTANEDEARLKYAGWLKKIMSMLLPITIALCGMITAAMAEEKVPVFGLIGTAGCLALAGVISAIWTAFMVAVGVYWGRYSPGEWNWFSFTLLGIGAVSAASGWITYATANAGKSSETSKAAKEAVEKGSQKAQAGLAKFGKILKGAAKASAAEGANLLVKASEWGDANAQEKAARLAKEAGVKGEGGSNGGKGGKNGGNRA